MAAAQRQLRQRNLHTLGIDGALPDGWTERHEAEADFQRQKRLRRCMESLREGAFPATDISTAMLADIVAMREKEVRSQREYANRVARTERLRAGPTPNALLSKRVVLSRAIPRRSTAGFADALRRAGAALVADAMQADIFVVADIATVPPRVQWLAVLGGGRVCDMKFVLSGGKHGVSVLYKRAMATRRTVFLSDAFITRHPKLAGLVLRKAGDPCDQAPAAC